jgi:hypothetical protein
VTHPDTRPVERLLFALPGTVPPVPPDLAVLSDLDRDLVVTCHAEQLARLRAELPGHAVVVDEQLHVTVVAVYPWAQLPDRLRGRLVQWALDSMAAASDTGAVPYLADGSGVDWSRLPAEVSDRITRWLDAIADDYPGPR